LREALGIHVHLHIEQSCRTCVSFEQSPYATFYGPCFLPAFATIRDDLHQPFFDPLLEAFVHRLFLGLPCRTPTEDKHFLSIRGRNQPDLQPFMHLLPVFAQ